MSDIAMLFSGTSHPALAEEVAKELKIELGQIQLKTFPDGEIGVQILENVRGRDVFVMQSIARNPNFYLMELLIIVDALMRASAGSISVVIPYFGYARQDRKDRGRVPITAKLVANMLEAAGVDRVVTMDLHSDQIQGFFDVPVDNLPGQAVLLERVKKLGLSGVVVAPDIGSSRIARDYADALGWEMAIVDKRRMSDERVHAGALIGSVEGKDVLIVDDMVSTGGTLKKASVVCREMGAKKIIAAVTHGLLLGDLFSGSAIGELIITNTLPPGETLPESVTQVSAAGIFAKVIDSICKGKSVSGLL